MTDGLVSIEKHRRAVRRAGLAMERYKAVPRGKGSVQARERALRWFAAWMAASGVRKLTQP